MVYQSCGEDFFASADEQIQISIAQKYQLPKKYILYVGSLIPRKNALGLVRAYHALSDQEHRLVLVGDGKSYNQKVISRVYELGLQDKVLLLNHVPQEDLPAIYKMASLFVYPSYFEGFGIPIIEAMASGVPVVTSTGSCFSEAAGKDSLFVDPDDTQGLKEAMDGVLSNSQKRLNMIKSGKEYVKKFQAENTSKNLMQVYEKLLEN